MNTLENINRIINADVLSGLKQIDDNSIDCVITSPPYWGLRDYNVDGQIGLEPTLELYLEHLLQVTAELKRVLKPTGVMFWNHGDTYSSMLGSHGNKTAGFSETTMVTDDKKPPKPTNIPQKCMLMQNYRLVLRMIDEQGWILRNIIIWHKPNHMPSSVKDRFATGYEPVFMLVKNQRYWFDLDAVRAPHSRDWSKEKWTHSIRRDDLKENSLLSMHGGNKLLSESYNRAGKNPGDVWAIPTQPFPESHFATFPEKLVEPMIKSGCPESGIVLDPFMGSGTTALVALKLNHRFIGIELNPEYVKMAYKRIEPYLCQKKIEEAIHER